MAKDIIANDDFDFAKAFEESFKEFEENSKIKATVADVLNDTVFLDFGYKSEAKLPITEFEKLPEVGEEVEVFLIRLEGKNGEPVVSKKIIDSYNTKLELKQLVNDKTRVTGKLLEVQRGGVIVSYKGIRGFIPFSLFDVRRRDDISDMVGQDIDFFIERISFKEEDIYAGNKSNQRGRRQEDFVANRKRVVIDEKNEAKGEFFEKTEVGAVLDGKVKAITDFGAFIDLGFVDALLRIKDISWLRINSVEDVLTIGEELRVQILSLDKDSKKITVGLKQLLENPWDAFLKKYEVGDSIVGSVVSIVTYGAFVKIIDGVEGLLHISDMSWIKKVNNPAEILTVGQNLDLKIIKIDTDNKKVSLSLKHLLENPWDQAEEKYEVGKRVKGKIKTITAFGCFIELEEGIDALLHVDDVSWTESIRNPHEYFNVDDEIEAVILQCDPKKAKIKIGIKQLADDPWKTFKDQYNVGDIITCKVEQVEDDRGILVAIFEDIKGFIPIAHLGNASVSEIKASLRTNFKVDDEVKAVVKSIDIKRKKINLSIKEYFSKIERENVEEFLHDSSEDVKYTLGDAMKNISNDE